MSDPRVVWLESSPLSPLLHSHGLTASELAVSQPAVRAWIEQDDVPMLLARVEKDDATGQSKLVFSSEMNGGVNVGSSEEVFLIKTQSSSSQPSSPDEFGRGVMVASNIGDAIPGLYQLIHSVFGPRIGASDAGLASKVGADVSALEAKLRKLALAGSAMQANRAAIGAVGAVDNNAMDADADVSSIKSVRDEVDYWHALSSSGGVAASRAESFLERLSSPDIDLASKWEAHALASLRDEELSRLLEDTQYALSELWLAQPDRGEPYLQARMEHLMHLLSAALVHHLRSSLGRLAIWRDAFPRVKQALARAQDHVKQWQQCMTELVTNEFGGRWRRAQDATSPTAINNGFNASSNQSSSNSSAFPDQVLDSFGSRLAQLLHLRGVHEELLALLTRDGTAAQDSSSPSSSSSLGSAQEVIGSLFDRLGIDPLNSGFFSSQRWDVALGELDKVWSGVEMLAATKLKDQLYNLADRPELLVAALASYSNLLRRSNLSRALDSERRTLLQQLTTRLDELKTTFDSHANTATGMGSAPPPLKNQPSLFLARLIWSHQLQRRITNLRALSNQVLQGIAGSDRFDSMAAQLGHRMKEWSSEMYESWKEDTIRLVSDESNPLALQTSGRLMDLDLQGSGQLRIHFNERLVTLIREVRQLREFGYAIPESISKVVSTAEKYYKYGLKLKQVATFYNTIHERILPSQMAMLLHEATEFERTIKEQRGTAWKDTEECERFMSKLMAASDALTQRNTKLKALHNQLVQGVAQLLQPNSTMDLLRGREAFLDHIASLRSLIDKEARRGLSQRDAIALWRNHWNAQLFKVLSWQYRWMIEMLQGDGSQVSGNAGGVGSLIHTATNVGAANGLGNGLSSLSAAAASIPSLLDIPLELRLSTSTKASVNGGSTQSSARLVFRPPLEEVRSSYYRNLKRFLDLPKLFLGVSENTSGGSGVMAAMPGNGTIFSAIPERHGVALYALFKHGEMLFTNLKNLTRRFASWIALASIHDLEQHCLDSLQTVMDWEVNFRALKARKKEFEKLPDSIRVGCFVVSLAGFKASVEDLMHKFHESLLLSLKKSTTEGLKRVTEFLDKALDVLNKPPQSVNELAAARMAFTELQQEQPTMQQLMDGMGEKDALLRQMAHLALDLSSVAPRWSLFLGAASSFDQTLEAQKATLREGLSSQAQQTQLSIDKFGSRWSKTKPNEEDIAAGGGLTPEKAESILAELDDWKNQLDGLVKQVEELQSHCTSFGMDVPSFPTLDALRLEIDAACDSWRMFDEYSKELSKMANEDWISFRKEVSSVATLLDRWSAKLKNRGVRDAVGELLVREIRTARELYPLLQMLAADFLENEHFKMLFALLKFDGSVNIRNVTLQHFLASGPKMLERKTEIRQLVERAQGEVVIRESVENLKVWADKCLFNLMEQTTGNAQLGNTHIIREWKELFTQISDQQALVGSLKESPYYAPFADTCQQFEQKLSILDEVLHSLNIIQRKYLYLEPIFSRGALPSEQARFKRIDTEFRSIMKDVAANPQVLALTTIPDIASTVTSMVEQLDRCQKALNDFLEEKRSKFPRFYFIGDDDLLEIIGQAENPLVIQNHLKKLFAGIHRVEFSQDCKRIVSMCSSEGEVVPLVAPVHITADIEGWLSSLSTCMEQTLQDCLVRCMSEFDLAKFPSQILNLAEQIHFTHQAEVAIQKQSLPQLQQQLQGRLQEYTSTEIGDEDSVESRLLQLKLKSLVMDLIHHIDVVRQLMDDKVSSIDHWLWQKQLRFYLRQTDKIAVIRMVDSEFTYSYEYIGNVDKLVHTPLSDKCYLVLTQGMHLGYGGCPFGPAGTGKTESVKALGNAFGRQTLVFNCDEGIDFQSMGRIFTGLVKSGAWGCFDEFNRLKEDQLSAISQQIQVIQAAIKSRAPRCELLGQNIQVNPNAAIFVTMNPASRDYGGRSKLPHNLKQLFRDISMALPDFKLICQTILMAEGFSHAEVIGRKITEVFELSKQLLSQQRHYDWGLRAMKTVLRHAGQLIHAEKRKANQTLSMELESSLLIGALEINTLSKLTYADSVRFQGLISDVFPGCKSEALDYGVLSQHIRDAITELKLELVESQVAKILQLHEALNQRMGVVIVGPSGAGKSVMLNVLHAALAKKGQQIVRHVMNPKALERNKLLGKMDNDTREWTDGVLTAAARQVQREPANTHTWIIADGDVDPEWIESLNSVLDDNHLLTMPNGERIKFGSNVNFIFETHSLDYASPATVSRMGMIFLSEEDTEISALVASWIKKQDANIQMRLSGWMEEMFYSSLDWVIEANSEVVPRTKVGLVMTALSHLRGVTTKAEFCIGLIRGIGCNLPLDRRQALATKIWGMSGERLPDARFPLDVTFNRQTGRLENYAYREEPIPFESLSFRSPPLVNTVDMQRNRDLVMSWLQNMEPFLLVGPEGCGRTLLLEHCFKTIKHATVTTIHCSAQTNASHVLSKLAECCATFSTAKGRVLRPKEGERLILFLKDLNLPKPDKYATSQLIACLQQLVTHKGFYDDNLDWVGLEKVQIVCCMNVAGVGATALGRHALSTRFTATVHVAFMTYPDRDALLSIYTSFLKSVLHAAASQGGGRLPDPTWSSDANIRKLCGTVVEVYEKVRAKFSVDDARHYSFNPRDLTQWLIGLLRYDLMKENLLDIVGYECYRLFADRLISAEHTKAFEHILYGLMNSHWKHGNKIKDMYYTSLQQYSLQALMAGGGGGGAAAAGADGEPVVTPVTAELGSSLDRVSLGDYRELCAEGLTTFEREYKSLNILLFQEILDHLAWEERVLSAPGGSLLLIGDAGVGRRTTITLIAHLLRLTVATPHLSKKYDSKAFRNELKEWLKSAGVEGKQMLLYIEDHHLVESSILEDINSLLSSGEVAGLFTPQEMEPMLAPLKEAFVASGMYRNLAEFFTARVRSNMHIVLSMDPNHPMFASRCESNPALFTRCTCLWLGRWSRMGMVEVPRLKLEKLLSSGASAQPMDANRVLDALLFIHSSAIQRGLCATPLTYVSFIDTYARLYESKQSGLAAQKKHLLAGLQKLTDAAQQVDVLSKDAHEKAAAVSQKQKEADSALEQITQRMAQASERKVEVEQLQKSLGQEEAKLNVRRGEIQAQLADIQPVLNAAREAVGGIKKDNLNEIRAFRMPPAQIHAVLCGVLGLMKQEDTSWQNMKKFLGSPSVKEDILNFDVTNVDAASRQKVQALINKNPDAFNKEKMMRVNVAAAPLASWVHACVRYSAVLESIKPLRQQFEDADRQLAGARNRVKQCEDELKQLDDEVQTLKARFAKTTAEAETLKVALQKTKETLDAAQLLLGKLSGERQRWEGQVVTLTSGLEALTFNSMLAAAFCSYLGSCPEDARRSALSEWCAKLGVQAFDLCNFLSSESELLQWKGEGLPADALSMENSLIILNSQQVPFIIDPTGSATTWLQTHLSGKTLEVVMQQEARFMTTLELAVRFGKTLIIAEVDGLSPVLYPLVRRDLVGVGPRKMVQVGDKSVDYNDSFRLFLVTRNPLPDLPSDARALVNEVNFSVTRSGLEGQLLGLTIGHEKPQLETKKSELLAAEDKLKVQLAELEKRLLNELAQSEGDILANKSLIESLNQTKSQSSEIATSLQSSKEIQADLDRQRDVYRPIAQVGSTLFFLITQLSSVNNLYEFSLPAFTQLFKQNLEAPAGSGMGASAVAMAAASGDKESARVASLTATLKLQIFTFITRSLFKADRLMFALHFVHCIDPNLFHQGEWEFLSGQLVGDGAAADMSLPVWAPKERAAAFANLASTFPALVRSARLNDEQSWGRWMKSSRPEVEFPAAGPGEPSLTAAQRLLFMKTFRPDRLQTALTSFACECLGVSSLSPPPLNLARMVKEESSPAQPLLFLCEGGADPTAELEDMASKTVGSDRFYQVALGSGQTDGALQLLYRCAKEGSYLLLKNLHLVSPWLLELEKHLKLLQPHPEFRLMMTTEQSEHFPSILLQESLLISYESPPGIKQNLLRTYEGWDAAFLQRGGSTRAQLLFVLAWFHAITQERRTYIPQGWSKMYEFSFADLRSGADIIDNLLAKMGALVSTKGGAAPKSEIDPASFPWLTVWGLLKYAIYGGRIDNEHDVRVLVTYLRKFFSKDILNTSASSASRKLTQGLELPNSNNHGDYLRLINKLPDIDPPALFSLPENVEGAVQETSSMHVLTQLRKLAVSSSSLVRFDRDVWRTQLTPLLQLWEKYSTRDNRSLLNRPPKLAKKEEHYTPLEAFIVLENAKAANLLALISSALGGISGVMYGSGLLTPDIQSDGAALLSGETPWRWAKNWYGPSEPSQWLTELVARKQSLLNLLQRTDAGHLLSAPIPLGQLFTPKVCLNALRQQTARQTGKAIDTLKLAAAFDQNQTNQSQLVMTVSGLLLQGCGFSGGLLCPLQPDAPSLLPLPNCSLYYIPMDESDPYGDPSSSLSVPVYVAPTREEFVCEIRMPCKGQQERWILSGVAVCLNDYK